ncbi:DUF6115 domain-containing protein [Brachyspira hyodysenteriae]|uniref:Uncharacterized protein n=1 Tax=Brachyspira hyodysenteriae (strain ATCC 49526 / WA1) TaxID=565034 RepID=A0A3B6VCB7_BRAHW|nr:hypothetical protein [Brachyspira hyodysenteriae]ACN83051.1 hypothetical protein BHWA1_00555 [Brachyspira hyodysenteriae WA1]AUJ48796.1 hypothetical protein BH718_00337 [Brachyspira hyodysenteriae]KLI18678.1 hypothetical protein SU45_01900 [Brachyspira hyodysenteriae]KLI24276.1 hypothetical protein SU43_05330 [Brachyspira hyodysenteriae]KLI40728.1 hypothetical protein SZ53_08225 [Brachyspira hyodysenteriae]
MQIVISIIINIVILAVTLPLFYIYIVSKARERLEKETMSKAREEIEALVKEFNNIALSRISILEDSIVRANRLVKELNNFQNDKKDNNIKNNNNAAVKKEIKIEENIDKTTEEKKLDISVQEPKNIESNNNNIVMNNEDKNKKLDIRVDDNNTKINSKTEKTEKIEKAEIKEEKKETKPKPKKNNIDTAAKAIDDEARREVIEKLRSKLDRTIKTNMAIYDKPIEDKTIAFVNDPLDTTVKDSNKNENIIKLYKQGFSKEEIAKKLNCSITEIDIVIDLEL